MHTVLLLTTESDHIDADVTNVVQLQLSGLDIYIYHNRKLESTFIFDEIFFFDYLNIIDLKCLTYVNIFV